MKCSGVKWSELKGREGKCASERASKYMCDCVQVAHWHEQHARKSVRARVHVHKHACVWVHGCVCGCAAAYRHRCRTVCRPADNTRISNPSTSSFSTCVCVRAGGRAGVHTCGRAGRRACVHACKCVCARARRLCLADCVLAGPTCTKAKI